MAPDGLRERRDGPTVLDSLLELPRKPGCEAGRANSHARQLLRHEGVLEQGRRRRRLVDRDLEVAAGRDAGRELPDAHDRAAVLDCRARNLGFLDLQ